MNEEYILFMIAGSTYAVLASQVQWVDIPEHITPVPNAPSFVEGIVLARGQVIPVISVRRRFHLEPVPIDIRSRLMVMTLDGRRAGLLVDSAREFVRLDPEMVHPLPQDLTGPGREYLQGVMSLGKDGTRLVLMINLYKLLNPEEQKELAEVPSLSDTTATQK